MAYGCKICIAVRGLKASEIPSLPQTEAEFAGHLRTAHGLQIVGDSVDLDAEAYVAYLLGWLPTPEVREQLRAAIESYASGHGLTLEQQMAILLAGGVARNAEPKRTSHSEV